MNIKRIAATALALGVLAGCGGGGGGSSTANPVVNSGTSVTLNSGVFVDLPNDLALAVLPTQGATRTWYGLRVIAGNVLPVNYQGDLSSSTLAGVSRSLVGRAVNTGTAALTATAESSLTGLLTIDSTDSSPARSIRAAKATALTSAELASSWSGTWTVKDDSATSAAVTLPASLEADDVRVSNFLGCAVSVPSLTNQSGADGVYNVSLSFSGGACPISGTRSGVLMAYALETVKHLRLVVFNSGLTESVSFRASR